MQTERRSTRRWLEGRGEHKRWERREYAEREKAQWQYKEWLATEEERSRTGWCMVREGQHVKSRMGGAKPRGGPQCHRTDPLRREENNSTCTDGGIVFLPLCLSVSTIQPLMQTNIYAEHRCQRNCRVSRPKQLGLCHCTERRWRRKWSCLLTTTKTGIGSSDTIQDSKERFPALPYSPQLVQDQKCRK